MPYILLVEDNDAHALLLQRSLRKIANALPVQRVSDGQSALGFLATKAQERDLPILVLLDIRLPRLGGFEVLKHIRDSPGYDELTTIVLSTSKSSADIQLANEYGADDFWSKPVSVDTLKTCLDNITLKGETPDGTSHHSAG